MSSHIENVSIDLRNLDGIVLDGESDKENGGDSSTRPAVEDILKNHDKAMHRWNTIFIIVCAIAVLIDPLLLYFQVVKEEHMCFTYDKNMVLIYLGLRTAVDVFYIIDIIIFLCGICKKRIGKIFGACNTEKERAVPFKVRKQCLLRLSILPRILVALPIPEGLVIFAYFNTVEFAPLYVIIIVIVPFQYTLRIFLIYGSQRWRPIKKTKRGRWLNPLLDFLPFILASHLFGALWYSLAVQRLLDCWKPHCKEVKGYPCSLSKDLRYCGSMVTATRVQELCPTKILDPKIFDFGIFAYAHQSNVTNSSHLKQKISLSFWWALRNLSSFGSNLNTSMNMVENFFSVAISICGMALFLVYLNARVQESQARSNQHKQKEKKHLMKTNIDLWLSRNDLFNLKTMIKDSKDQKTTIKKKTLKTVIIENIDKIEANKDIDLQSIIYVLPIKFKKNISRLLCLSSLKKVPIIANLNAKMLKVICEHLKPVIYTEDDYIVQEGKPLGMMLFITQGLAWSYTTKNINGIGGQPSFDSSSNEWLKKGDFYGEELLNWAFKSPSFSALPISTRTVISQEKVEAFAIRASDLKSIVCKLWWHFTSELEQVDLEQWENSAASSIQAAWRNRLARARRSNRPNRWDRFIAHY